MQTLPIATTAPLKGTGLLGCQSPRLSPNTDIRPQRLATPIMEV